MTRTGGGVKRFSAVELLIALGLFFAVTPFVEELPRGDLIEAVLLTVVFLSAVLAIGGRRRTYLIAVVLAVPAIVGKWLSHFRPDLIAPPIYLVAALVFGLFVIGHLQLFVLRARSVDSGVLCSAICAYLLMGLVWAFAYILVTQLSPGSFSFNTSNTPKVVMDGFTAFYFSFSTQSTAGFGDITPVSKIARMLAVMQATAGSLYLAILIARLVGMYSPTHTNRPQSADRP
ncbi:MAG TPA: ion channel [Chthoniobacterales bacterium]|nr:ion channel [Chthoniobacterales bacterium]